MSSTLDFQLIKSIGQEWKDLITGFIKEMSDNEGNDDIPSLIVYTCLLLYYHRESFNNVGTNVNINNLKNEIWSDGTGRNQEVPTYGKMEIDMIKDKNKKFEWIFKIKRISAERSRILIGIDNCIGNECKVRIGHGSYRSYRNDTKAKNGDEIKMILDVNRKQLEFYINNSPITSSGYRSGLWQIRDTDSAFYMCVALNTKDNNCVKLCSFHQSISSLYLLD